MKRNESTVRGRVAQVDICPDEAGYVLSVGAVSLWLDRRTAEDVVATLGQALWVDDNVPRDGREGVAEIARRTRLARRPHN